MNHATLIERFKSLFYDYLVILFYAISLGIFTFSFYSFILDGIPEFNSIESHLISFFLMIFPVYLYFVITEMGAKRASFGKRIAKIKIESLNAHWSVIPLRNLLKLCPWQLGHMAVIEGIYFGFNSLFVYITYGLAVVLPIIYIITVSVRKDHRGIIDLLTHTIVIKE
jgi:uncharacterized RDD family membrane protein YckC